MKRISVSMYLVVLSVVLLPYFASAQGSDPPDCCNNGSNSVVSQMVSVNQILISDDSLLAMGLSRSDLVDRLAGSLLLGKSLDLIISVGHSIVPGATSELSERAGSRAAVEGTLLGVQENRTYRVPRARLQASDLDALDELSITDGTVVIRITFKKAALSQ